MSGGERVPKLQRRVKIVEGLAVSIPIDGGLNVLGRIVAVEPGIVAIATYGVQTSSEFVPDAIARSPDLIALVSGYDVEAGLWPVLGRWKSAAEIERPAYIHGMNPVRIRSFGRSIDVPLIGTSEGLRRETSYSDNVLAKAASALAGQREWSERYSALRYDDWREYARVSNQRLRESLV